MCSPPWINKNTNSRLVRSLSKVICVCLSRGSITRASLFLFLVFAREKTRGASKGGKCGEGKSAQRMHACERKWCEGMRRGERARVRQSEQKKSERYYARSGVIRNERESPALRDATVNQVAPAIVRNNWSIDVDLATIVPRAYCRWCCYIVLVSQARRKQNTAKTIFKVRGTLQWLQEKDRLPPLPPPPVCSCSGSDRADTDPTRRRRSKEERKEE